MGVLLSKPANGGIIISGSQIIEACGGIIVFSAEAEGIDVPIGRCFLVAEGIVVIGLGDRAATIGDAGISGARGVFPWPFPIQLYHFTRQ